MNISAKICLTGILALLAFKIYPACAQVRNNIAIELNNAGVTALKKNDWRESIKNFNAALEENSNFQIARLNLAVAHNNLALQLAAREHRFKDALKEFHQAIFLDPENQTTVGNFNYVLVKLGKKPKNFEDRISLGDEARHSGELRGAVVEYRAALKLKNDNRTRRKLGDAYHLLNEKDKALAKIAAIRDAK